MLLLIRKLTGCLNSKSLRKECVQLISPRLSLLQLRAQFLPFKAQQFQDRECALKQRKSEYGKFLNKEFALIGFRSEI